MQVSNNNRSTVETIVKTNEHYPSIKLIKAHIQKENNDFNIKAASLGQINKIFKGLNPKKATGSDKIPVKIVKLATSVIGSHLSNIINNDLSNNAFSDSAKLASVRSVNKKYDRNEIKTYRPVSISIFFSKICEKFLNKQLLHFVNRSLSELMSTYRDVHITHHVVIRLIENWR